jgi:hypothetical protein
VSVASPVATTAYILTDTTDWGNAIGEEGQRAVLRRGGLVMDTVDLDFGIISVGQDSVVYLPVDSARYKAVSTCDIGSTSVTLASIRIRSRSATGMISLLVSGRAKRRWNPNTFGDGQADLA